MEEKTDYHSPDVSSKRRKDLRPETASFTMAAMTPPLDFYELRKRQKIRSLAVAALLFLFYFLAVGLLLLAAGLTAGFFAVRPVFAGSGFWTKFIVLDVLLAAAVAAFHYLDARKNGPAYLIKRLSAKPPDPADRYHRMFADAVAGVRLAAGLPAVDPLILPTFSLNSLALILPGGRPAVLVTEGLLADCARDEVEAVVAHEMGHIARGDTTLLTLVCGLSSFFERLRDACESEVEEAAPVLGRRNRTGAAAGLLYAASAAGAAVIRFLEVFVSRERELLADAAAVEFGRSPMALARAVYKAQARNVFIGDFSQAFAPLFLIAPSAPPEDGAKAPRWSSTHPAFEERIRLLAAMARRTPEAVAGQVRDAAEARKKARTIAAPAAPPPAGRETEAPPERRDWMMIRPGRGETGPAALEELIEADGFSPSVLVRNLADGLDGRAGDFPEIRDALRRRRQGRPVVMRRLGLCPRCRIPLGDTHYEGVPAGLCRRCGGKSIDPRFMNRIIARREIGFSADLVKKAEAFERERLLNPAARRKSADPRKTRLICPSCGCPMIPRPFNYQYVVPVDKCGSCGRIWFDADELETLQILIERARTDEKERR